MQRVRITQNGSVALTVIKIIPKYFRSHFYTEQKSNVQSEVYKTSHQSERGRSLQPSVSCRRVDEPSAPPWLSCPSVLYRRTGPQTHTRKQEAMFISEESALTEGTP